MKLKNSEFKVGTVVVIDCNNPIMKYVVTKQDTKGIYVKLHDGNMNNEEYGPYGDGDGGCITFKIDPDTKQFFPEPGDTIVCANGKEYICCTRENYVARHIYKNSAIYTEQKPGYDHMNWRTNSGVTEDNPGFNIFKIIPAEKPKVLSLKVDVQNLDEVQSTLRTLELENKFLRTLLRRQGVDI